MRQWYERQCGAATTAVAQAQRVAQEAARDAAEADAAVADVDAETVRLWTVLGGQLGGGGQAR